MSNFSNDKVPLTMTQPTVEKIEILSVDLLDQQRTVVEELKQLAQSLRLEFGWHYLLDLSWIISQLGEVKGKCILDAGAGTGVLQWYLAQHGAEVISVDRGSRAALPLRFRKRFHVQGLTPGDLLPTSQVLAQDFGKKAFLRDLQALIDPNQSPGKVTLYHQDLKSLADLTDQSLDAIVAVSALEHNTPEGLSLVVTELMRVLKPGGLLVASLNAARDQDWWHEPSSGWCYGADSLRKLFDLPATLPSNYDRYDELFAALNNCSELRDHLAAFYSHSDKNGMPWGKWDPQYQPVGVCKQKPLAHDNQ
jgi:SAM-dependent methyltransferase